MAQGVTPLHGAGMFLQHCVEFNVHAWLRVLENGEHGSKAITYCPLPSLRPPRDNLVALLDIPPKATLHKPILMSLTIRNYHPTRSANVTVQLDPDSLDGFVISGVRNGRVPVLLPGSEEKLVWSVIPIECGYLKLPRIKVMDRRKVAPASQSSADSGAAVEQSAGDVVRVVDLRQDLRYTSPEGAVESTGESDATILVLP